MIDVYAAIYGEHYSLQATSLNASRKSVRADLSLLNIGPLEYPRLSVLNVGTGREAVVLHELGFGSVYHVDLSPAAVNSLTALGKLSAHYSNLHTAQLDLCADPLPFDCQLDLVYLNGVLHHLYDPGGAIQNIMAHAHDRTVFAFRIYRSGSLLFFVVDFIRRFIRYEDRERFGRAVDARSWVDSTPWLKMDMWDDFFVPVLRLYPAQHVLEYFWRIGWSSCLDVPAKPTDHSDPDGTPDSLLFAFTPTPDVRWEVTRFPDSVDQLCDFGVDSAEMRATVTAMRAALTRLADSSSEERLELAMDLYWIARRRTGESRCNRHSAIQAILGLFI